MWTVYNCEMRHCELNECLVELELKHFTDVVLGITSADLTMVANCYNRTLKITVVRQRTHGG